MVEAVVGEKRTTVGENAYCEHKAYQQKNSRRLLEFRLSKIKRNYFDRNVTKKLATVCFMTSTYRVTS